MEGLPVTQSTTDVDADLGAECARYLGGQAFPARQDDLLAALMHDRAPSRLLHHLAALDPTTVYATLADVLADCERRSAVPLDPAR